MSVCMCPHIGIDGIEDPIQRKRVDSFIKSISSDGVLASSGWSLLELASIADNGMDIHTILDTIPFRGGPCNRTTRCCGCCTRKCYNRCIQDCLHRLYIWKNTPEEVLPFGAKLAIHQKFESHRHLSWVVSEVISGSSNTKLKEYMVNEHIRPEENPNKMDYSPRPEIDPNSGKRRVNPISGELSFLEWPKSGLCPYCLPAITVDRRYKVH